METYRLNSKLVENEREFLIQTANDLTRKTVSSEIYVNGRMADEVHFPHPENIAADDMLKLVKSTHGETKREVENILKAYKTVMATGDPVAMIQVARAFFYKRFLGEARDMLIAVIGMDDKRHKAYHMLAKTELALGDLESAIEAARTAVSMKPEFADYCNTLGSILIATREYEAAVKEFEKAININMYYSDAYFNCGLALLLNAIEQRNTGLFANVLSRSLDYFNKAALIYPEFKTSDFDRGLMQLSAHNLDQACDLFVKVRDAKEEQHRRKHASYVMKAALSPYWLSEQAVEERIEFLQREIENHPTYSDYQSELGTCYLERAHLMWKKAIDQYKRTLEQNPKLQRVSDHLELVEETHKQMREVIENIARKG